jgi:murein DD-endopeptidase MepM/ murein hydrolase activator NlpD
VAALRIQGAVALDGLRLRVGNRHVALGAPNDVLPRTLWIGVDLEQPPGPLEVVLDGMARESVSVTARTRLTVVDANYPVQRLTVPRSFTELDAATLARITAEKATLDRLWEAVTPTRMWRAPFRPPLDDGAHGSGFGLRRVINGEPRAPHTGVDFSVPAGTPVLAANAGLVVLAEEHFFAGRSLVLDHGEGLYTMYFHLQESVVAAGRRVAQGELIGRVGKTGRATGPHLHWGARLHGARIDPAALLHLRPE